MQVAQPIWVEQRQKNSERLVQEVLIAWENKNLRETKPFNATLLFIRRL